MATAYSVLGVSPAATHDEIRAAFRVRCEECHPDHAKDEADRAARTAKMAKVTLAWRYLGDEQARAKYDLRLADLAKALQASDKPFGSEEPADGFLQRLRSASGAEAEAMAEEFGRAAGLEGEAIDRARKVARKGLEVAGGAADLVGLFRGLQR